MKKIQIKDCIQDLKTLGRVYLSEEDGVYCNWTCSGVEFVLCGTALAVRIKAVPGVEQEVNMMTAAFENMVNDPNRLFYSQDENGWMSHAAVAARRLHADFSVVSCSGIAVTEGIGTIENK